MGTRTRWGRIDSRVQVQIILVPYFKVMKLNRKTLQRRVQEQLLFMASPSPFLNFMNKFRLDEILINQQYKGVYSMRTSATITELATYMWNIMSTSDRQPYISMAKKAQQLQQVRRQFLFSQSVSNNDAPSKAPN